MLNCLLKFIQLFPHLSICIIGEQSIIFLQAKLPLLWISVSTFMSESDIDLSSNELELERAFSALYILMGKPSAKEFGRLMGDRAENWVVRMRERRLEDEIGAVYKRMDRMEQKFSGKFDEVLTFLKGLNDRVASISSHSALEVGASSGNSSVSLPSALPQVSITGAVPEIAADSHSLPRLITLDVSSSSSKEKKKEVAVPVPVEPVCHQRGRLSTRRFPQEEQRVKAEGEAKEGKKEEEEEEEEEELEIVRQTEPKQE